MAENPTAQILIGRMTFLAIAFGVFFIQLLPLNTTPIGWPGPDILLICTAAWVSRRPDYLPVWMVLGVYFLGDLIFFRPPGLWTALVIILTEFLRVRAPKIRDIPFALEWGMVAFGIVAITIANHLILGLVVLEIPSLGPLLLQLLVTIAIYPLVVLIAHFIFGVSRPSLGQTDNYGHRL
jgi:rod shape-determining protein MreD